MSQNSTEQARNLEQAFTAFNRMSVQLESSYRDLENRVSVLHQELAAARSERLQQLAEKERLADRLERLLELLPGGVLVLDGQGRVTHTNPMAEDLLTTGLKGQSWSAILSDYCEHCLDEFGEVKLKNGRHISLSMRALDSEPGHIVLLMDVSDQHELRTLVKRQDRLAAMGEMAASLAHQIRTPLATALLYASNLGKDNLDACGRERMTQRLVQRLRHLEHMVNDLLRFTRDDSFTAALIDLHELLESFRQIIQPQVEQLCGQLQLPQSTGPVMILADREALLGVFLNLANNALQCGGKHTGIRITVDDNGSEMVRIRFADDGPGIAADVADKIFTPFYTTRSEGTGLGLAMVQATLRAHHGDIKLLSPMSNGAVFEIRLPVANAKSLLPSGDSRTDETLVKCDANDQKRGY